MAVAMPTIKDLPYHSDKLPTTTPEAVATLSKIMRFDIHPQTKRDEYTLDVLCGVILFRHLDRFQQGRVREMIINRDHIHMTDWDKLNDFCTDMSVQPRWWLWSLTTPELDVILKDQERMKGFFTALNYSAGISTVIDLFNKREDYKNEKDPQKKRKILSGVKRNLVTILIASTFSYVNDVQLENTKSELDRRTANPKSSGYHQ